MPIFVARRSDELELERGQKIKPGLDGTHDRRGDVLELLL
jgi:hypothetical protein